MDKRRSDDCSDGRQERKFEPGSGEHQSPRESDSSEDDHEIIDMIRQQLYGPGGPLEYEDHEFSLNQAQKPAEKVEPGPSNFRSWAINRRTMIHQSPYGPGTSLNQSEGEIPSFKRVHAKPDESENEGVPTFSRQPANNPQHANKPVKRVRFQPSRQNERVAPSHWNPYLALRNITARFRPSRVVGPMGDIGSIDQWLTVNRQPVHRRTDPGAQTIQIRVSGGADHHRASTLLGCQSHQSSDGGSNRQNFLLQWYIGDSIGQRPPHSQPPIMGDTGKDEFGATNEDDGNHGITFEYIYPNPAYTEAHKQCKANSNQQPAKQDSDVKNSADTINPEPVNSEQTITYGKGSCKRQCESSRRVDNDEDNHESLTMIRQQMYGPGGPYGNRPVSQTDSESRTDASGNRKRHQDHIEDEENSAFSQQPIKKPRLMTGTTTKPSSSSFDHEEKQNSEFSQQPTQQNSLKRKDKSPRKEDNDEDNHETLSMIRQQMYGPGGPYGNRPVSQTDSGSRIKASVNRKRRRDDHEDEENAAFSQQSAEKPRLMTRTTMEPSSSSFGNRKRRLDDR